jgi:DNA modification methylase
LINSNRKEFRYSWVWEKSVGSGFLNAKKMPLKCHELVLVWYKKLPTYTPVLTNSVRTTSLPGGPTPQKGKGCYGDVNRAAGTRAIGPNERYPRSVLKVGIVDKSATRIRHPTEKPVELVEYMIKTYTNPGELVLDPCMGTGATMIAAHNLSRDGVGFELELDYFNTTKQRLDIFGQMCYTVINS